MTRSLLLAALLAAAPLAALAAPAVDDVVGTTPEEATAALKELGCLVQSFTTEDGKIEAKCVDETGKHSDVYIDLASGKITDVKESD